VKDDEILNLERDRKARSESVGVSHIAESGGGERKRGERLDVDEETSRTPDICTILSPDQLTHF